MSCKAISEDGGLVWKDTIREVVCSSCGVSLVASYGLRYLIWADACMAGTNKLQTSHRSAEADLIEDLGAEVIIVQLELDPSDLRSETLLIFPPHQLKSLWSTRRTFQHCQHTVPLLLST